MQCKSFGRRQNFKLCFSCDNLWSSFCRSPNSDSYFEFEFDTHLPNRAVLFFQSRREFLNSEKEVLVSTGAYSLTAHRSEIHDILPGILSEITAK